MNVFLDSEVLRQQMRLWSTHGLEHLPPPVCLRYFQCTIRNRNEAVLDVYEEADLKTLSTHSESVQGQLYFRHTWKHTLAVHDNLFSPVNMKEPHIHSQHSKHVSTFVSFRLCWLNTLEENQKHHKATRPQGNSFNDIQELRQHHTTQRPRGNTTKTATNTHTNNY